MADVTGSEAEEAERSKWSIDFSDLDVHLHNVIAPLSLGGEPTAPAPAIRYARCVAESYCALRDVLGILAPIRKMLAFEGLPLATPLGPLARHEWLHACRELMLVRATTVRDCAIKLTGNVFELRAKVARDAQRVEKDAAVRAAGVSSILSRIGGIATDLRKERNALVHEGCRPELGGDPLFEGAAVLEAYGQTGPGLRVTDDGGPKTVDLRLEHAQLAKGIDESLHVVLAGLQPALWELVEALYAPFLERWNVKTQLPGQS